MPNFPSAQPVDFHSKPQNLPHLLSKINISTAWGMSRPFATSLIPRQRDILGFLGSLIGLRLADPRIELYPLCAGWNLDVLAPSRTQQRTSILKVDVGRLGSMLMQEKTVFLQFSGTAGIEHLKFQNPFRAA